MLNNSSSIIIMAFYGINNRLKVECKMTTSDISPYKGSAQITREQFLFYEMRTTARLMREGLSDEEILKRIVEENLFQYPTEKTIKRIASACI